MLVRNVVTALGLAAAGIAMTPSAAQADPWCTSTYGYNARKMGYDAYVKGKAAGLGATPNGALKTFSLDAGKYPSLTPLYIGRFSDRELPAPAYWAYDKGEVSFKLTKEKDPTGYLNRLGMTDRLGLSVHVCVYKSPLSGKDWTVLETRETSPGNPNASLKVDGKALYGASSSGKVAGLIESDYVVVYIVRDSMNFTGKFTLAVTSKRVERKP